MVVEGFGYITAAKFSSVYGLVLLLECHVSFRVSPDIAGKFHIVQTFTVFSSVRVHDWKYIA